MSARRPCPRTQKPKNKHIYHVLSDTVYILSDAYRAGGISRPAAQVRAEAMDVMLQTVSGDNKKVTQAFMCEQIRQLVERYRPLTESFDDCLAEIIKRRGEKRAAMKPQELADEVFSAYLGSLDLNEAGWRAEYKAEAAAAARCDLLLDAVARKEELSVSEEELHRALEAIAKQCGAELEQVVSQIDRRSVREQLLRDKARAFITESAVSSARA